VEVTEPPGSKQFILIRYSENPHLSRQPFLIRLGVEFFQTHSEEGIYRNQKK